MKVRMHIYLLLLIPPMVVLLLHWICVDIVKRQ